jgi:hypothetical protein
VTVLRSFWFRVPEIEPFRGKFNFSSRFPQYYEISTSSEKKTLMTAILTGAVQVIQIFSGAPKMGSDLVGLIRFHTKYDATEPTETAPTAIHMGL